jgi:hypothetical protein
MFSVAVTSASAQTAEEIIDTYIENIGGQEAWSKITAMKSTGIGKQQGVDYPFIATYMKDGRTLINIDLQGREFTVEAFDGETGWAMNFQTQKPEALDSESSLNYKNEAKDYMPDAFMDYKSKDYSLELVGKDTFEGTECFKIKLTKTPAIVDGKEEENVETYYFDTETFVPIAMEAVITSGQGKGATAQKLFSDYQEVDGLYVPFSVIDKFNGQVGLEMVMKTLEFNTEVDESKFKMPKEEATATSKN